MERNASGGVGTESCPTCEQAGIEVLKKACRVLGDDGADVDIFEERLVQEEITFKEFVRLVYELIGSATDESRKAEAFQILNEFITNTKEKYSAPNDRSHQRKTLIPAAA